MTDAQDAMIEGLCERLGLTDAAHAAEASRRCRGTEARS